MTLISALAALPQVAGRVFTTWPASDPPGLFAVVTDDVETPTVSLYGISDVTTRLTTVGLYLPAGGSQIDLINAYNAAWDAPKTVTEDATPGLMVHFDRETGIAPHFDADTHGWTAFVRFRSFLNRT